MTYRRPLVRLAALLACAACSAVTGTGGAPARAALLSDAPAPMDRPCRPAAFPADLPAASAMVDSAALTAAAAEVWRQAGSPRGHVLLAMAFDRQGVNVRRDLIEHRLPDALADTLQELVFAHRRSVQTAPREWGVRLRMDLGGEHPVLRVGRQQACAARARDVAALGYGGMGGFGGAGFGDVRDRTASTSMLAGDGSTVWVRVALDARGNVTDARLERTLMRPWWENRVLAYVRAISFDPATEDGWPVPGQLLFPLRLNR